MCVVKYPMGIHIILLPNGIRTKRAQFVDMVLGLMSSRNTKRMLINRVIITNNNTYYCDATDCETCLARFQCFTTKGDIIKTNKFIEKWRLRDGSSEYRAYKRGVRTHK